MASHRALAGALLVLLAVPSTAAAGPRVLHLAHTPATVRLPAGTNAVAFRWVGQPTATLGVTLVDGRGRATWQTRVGVDEDSSVHGLSLSELVSTPHATAVRLSGGIRGRLDLIPLDGAPAPSGPVAPPLSPQPLGTAPTVAMPPIVRRALWGANEAYRQGKDFPQAWPISKIVIHHTGESGLASGTDPQTFLRSIYEAHAVGLGYEDIAYNYVVDWNGVIYEGRSASPFGAPATAIPSEDANGNLIGGAHTLNFNAGTAGIAVMGNFSTAPMTPQARASLVWLVAWLSQSHGIDPLGATPYVNPAVPQFTGTFPNVAGHREVPNGAPTECPGNLFFPTLQQLRDEVTAFIATAGAAQPTVTPSLPTLAVSATRTTSETVSVAWPAGAGGVADLAVQGLPAGASASFDPAQAAGSSTTATLRVDVPLRVPAGRYVLTVAATHPRPDGSTGGGSATIALVVPKPCVVPRVVGKTLAGARTALRAAHCTAGTIRKVRSPRPAGRVASQATKPGSLRVPGFAVTLSVSRARPAV